jgi:endoglucanase
VKDGVKRLATGNERRAVVLDAQPRARDTDCMARFALLFALVATLTGCQMLPHHPRTAADANRLLARSLNMGNMLEAPNEGEWAVRIEDGFFPLIRQAGFTAVRIPVRWSAHALAEPPYTIDPTFRERVDHIVQCALRADLAVVLNVHHYEELMAQPDAHRARFLALWTQLADHYADAPDDLFLELLNEPNGALDDRAWSALARDALALVRARQPERFVIIGPSQWNNLQHLPHLDLPADDRRLIVTFHFYEPFSFTHQGASWVRGADAWLGNRWAGTPEETARIEHELEVAARWAREHDRPLFCGEFGAFSRADMASRERWTFFVARALEERGISWAYWEFASGFGVWDPDTRAWREPLRKALLP